MELNENTCLINNIISVSWIVWHNISRLIYSNEYISQFTTMCTKSQINCYATMPNAWYIVRRKFKYSSTPSAASFGNSQLFSNINNIHVSNTVSSHGIHDFFKHSSSQSSTFKLSVWKTKSRVLYSPGDVYIKYGLPWWERWFFWYLMAWNSHVSRTSSRSRCQVNVTDKTI